MLPCVLFEDEDLLVVNKPAGISTHAPGPFAGEGIYDWLRHREPRWAGLAIIHRLDKETSGVLVFGKSKLANQSLTEQFTRREVHKQYLLLTDRPVKRASFSVVSMVARAGEKYVSRPLRPGGESAETRFRVLKEEEVEFGPGGGGRCWMVSAEPVTGRTHQIRAQAAAEGFPILGDVLYGGSPGPRVCLHAESITLEHPGTGKQVTFQAQTDFAADARGELRRALVDAGETSAVRLIHGAADGRENFYVEKWGDYLLAQTTRPLDKEQAAELRQLAKQTGAAGIYHRISAREGERSHGETTSPQLVAGEAAPERFFVRENGMEFEISFQAGGSTGLFLDQRDNRRRILSNYVAAGFSLFEGGAQEREVLNTFAYTCGFSVCAAKAGAGTTSVDLSRNYLEWGRRNIARNLIDPKAHDFILGDVFDWLRRLRKKGRTFDLVLLDPPTFSRSKQAGAFRVEKDFGKLVIEALGVLKQGGVLFASTNAATWRPEDFLATVGGAIQKAGRKISRQHYFPQPPDFPIHRLEPAYLKTVWLRIA